MKDDRVSETYAPSSQRNRLYLRYSPKDVGIIFQASGLSLLEYLLPI
jgi:hypothetical protein